MYNKPGRGIDAVFQHASSKRYAVWEAKGGKWALDPGDLVVDTKGMVQLSDNFIESRLQRALRADPTGPNSGLIKTLQLEHEGGRLERFASFRGSRTTYAVGPYPGNPNAITY